MHFGMKSLEKSRSRMISSFKAFLDEKQQEMHKKRKHQRMTLSDTGVAVCILSAIVDNKSLSKSS